MVATIERFLCKGEWPLFGMVSFKTFSIMPEVKSLDVLKAGRELAA